MNKIIIDANVWIRFARSKDISPLLDRMIVYDFLPIANNYLLSEIFEAVVSNIWMNKYQAEKLIAFTKKILLLTTEKQVFALSPDAKDNYLFDPAIQNNCVFIISDDSELLDFNMTTIPIHPIGLLISFLFSFAGKFFTFLSSPHAILPHHRAATGHSATAGNGRQ